MIIMTKIIMIIIITMIIVIIIIIIITIIIMILNSFAIGLKQEEDAAYFHVLSLLLTPFICFSDLICAASLLVLLWPSSFLWPLPPSTVLPLPLSLYVTSTISTLCISSPYSHSLWPSLLLPLRGLFLHSSFVISPSFLPLFGLFWYCMCDIFFLFPFRKSFRIGSLCDTSSFPPFKWDLPITIP